MSLNVNQSPSTDGLNPQQPSTGEQEAPKAFAPLTAAQQNVALAQIRNDSYRDQQRAQHEQQMGKFLGDHQAAVQAGDPENPTPHQAATQAVAGAAAAAGVQPIPPGLQAVVSQRAPSTPAFQQLQSTLGGALNGTSTTTPKEILSLVHQTNQQMNLLSPEQMAPIDARMTRLLASPALSQPMTASAPGGIKDARATANAGGPATAGASAAGTAAAPGVAGAQLASDPSVGTAAPAQSNTTAQAAGVYGGSIQAIVMMALAGSMNESMKEKQDSVKELAKYAKISELLGKVLTDKLGPASQELNAKISKAGNKGSTSTYVSIAGYPQNIDLDHYIANDGTGNPSLVGDTKTLGRVNSTEMQTLTQELNQNQQTVQNKQTQVSNRINTQDSAINNTLGQQTSLLKIFMDTAAAVLRNV